MTKYKNKGETKDLSVKDFQTVKFMSAEEKCKVAKAWERFLVARLNMTDEQLFGTDFGYGFKPFSKSLYQHFSLRLGYIAHYSRHGFFHAQFLQWDDFLRNVRKLAGGIDGMGFPLVRAQVTEGVDGGSYGDLNRIIRNVADEYVADVELAFAKQRVDNALSSVESAGIEATNAKEALIGLLNE